MPASVPRIYWLDNYWAMSIKAWVLAVNIMQSPACPPDSNRSLNAFFLLSETDYYPQYISDCICPASMIYSVPHSDIAQPVLSIRQTIPHIFAVLCL